MSTAKPQSKVRLVRSENKWGRSNRRHLVTDYEEGIREEFQDIVINLAGMEIIVKDIKDLIKKHSKLLP
jgi:hypothetical protein